MVNMQWEACTEWRQCRGPHLVTYQTRYIKNVLRKNTVMWLRQSWFLEGHLSPHKWLHPPSQWLSGRETELKFFFSFFNWQWAHSSGGKRHASLSRDKLRVLELTLSAQDWTKARTFARFSPIPTKYAAAGEKEPFVPESTAKCDLASQLWSWRCMFYWDVSGILSLLTSRTPSAQRCLMGVIPAPHPGNIWQYLETFFTVLTGGSGRLGSYGHLVGGRRGRC